VEYAEVVNKNRQDLGEGGEGEGGGGGWRTFDEMKRILDGREGGESRGRC
jgi:hypothetical protein